MAQDFLQVMPIAVVGAYAAIVAYGEFYQPMWWLALSALDKVFFFYATMSTAVAAENTIFPQYLIGSMTAGKYTKPLDPLHKFLMFGTGISQLFVAAILAYTAARGTYELKTFVMSAFCVTSVGNLCSALFRPVPGSIDRPHPAQIVLLSLMYMPAAWGLQKHFAGPDA